MSVTTLSKTASGNIDNRRAETRRRVLKGATLTFNRGYSAFECLVRNQSEKGAMLSLGETFALPAQFDLEISGEAGRRKAHVRWRSLQTVGVSFD